MNDIVQYRKDRGQPRQHGNTVITPVNWVLTIKLPYWGIVWNRPVAVLVEDGDFTTEIAIVDVTLLAQLGMLLVGLAATIIGLLIAPTRSNR
jgi:hypothetical protein